MKGLLALLTLFGVGFNQAQAAVLEVPELCFANKAAPCLTQIQDAGKTLIVDGATFKISPNSILQWNSFTDLSLDLVKGSFILTDTKSPFKLNEIYISKPQQMIQRRENLILGLDLKSFILSTYKLSEVRSNTVLLKSEFLEKSQLLKYVSSFFERKTAYVEFLKSIESLWKAEFVSQTKIQTKVLERGVASVEEAGKAENTERFRQQLQLKKVREQFFNRTFYR